MAPFLLIAQVLEVPAPAAALEECLAFDRRLFTRNGRISSYVTAVLLTALTIWLRWDLASQLDRPALIIFVFPIMLSAFLGGLGPGLVSTILSALAAAWYFPPTGSFHIQGSLDFAQWLLLCLAGSVISLLSEAYRRSTRRALEAEHFSTQAATREETLRQSEEQLIQTFQFNPIPQAIIRIADGRYVDVNEGFARLFGYTREELVGKTSVEIGLFESNAKRAEIYLLLQEQGWIRDFEVVMLTKAGERRLIQVSANRIELRGKHCSLSSLVDISERRHAEEEIRRSQTLLAEAESLSHIGAWEWDLLSDRWMFSAEWLSIHGIRKSTLTSEELILITYPKDRPKITEAFENVRNGIRPYDLEYRIVRQDNGEIRMVRARGQFVRDPAGKIARVYGFEQDITEQKRAEAALRSERDFTSTLLETIGSQVVVLDTNGTIIRFNRAAEVASGFSRNEVEGKPIFDLLIPPEERQQVREVFTNLRVGNFPNQNENHWLTKDGSRRLFAWTNTAIADEGGNVRYIIGTGMDITERKEIETQALLNEAKLKSVLDNAPVGIFGADRTGLLEYLNRAGYELWGAFRKVDMSRYDEYRGWRMDTGKRLEPEDWALAGALRTGKTIKPQRVRIETFDGKTKYILNAAGPVLGKNGEVLGAVAITQDITDLVKAEHEAQKRSQQLQSIIDGASNTIVFVKDLEGRFITINRYLERLMQVSRKDIQGKTDYAFFSKERADFYRAVDQRVISQGIPGQFEELLPAANGELRTFLSDKFLLFDQDGKPYALCGVSVDITERKRTEEALRKSEQELRKSELRFRTYAEAMPQMAFIADPAGNITYHNQRFPDYTGININTGTWRWNDYSFIHPDELQPATDAWSESLATGAPYNFEYRVRRRDGQYRWHLVRALPVRDTEGRIQQWLGTITDIHEQKLVALTLAKAVKARDQFLSIASHELKTPLSSLRLQAQTLKRSIEKGRLDAYAPERINRLADQTDRQVSRLVRLVDDMLDVSRIESGRLVMQPEKAVFSDIVRDTVERLRPQMIAAGTDPIIDRLDDIDGSWDRFRMEQVLTNLLTNAMRYGNGKPVRISLHRQGQDGLLLSVRDQGMGISKENQARIFGRFERVSSNNERTGLGLGLFISSEIVKMHGGRIWVESEPGKGSSFFVKLPVRHETARKESA